MRASQRATVRAGLIGFLLHALTAAWAWRSWGYFVRGSVIAWIDFPASLVYMHRDDVEFLVASLLLGGLQWAVIAALLTLWVGTALRRG